METVVEMFTDVSKGLYRPQFISAGGRKCTKGYSGELKEKLKEIEVRNKIP